MPEPFAGHGPKRPQLTLKIEQLHLDPQNPRLPEEQQGKSEEGLLETLYQKFFLDEIAESMAKNGYFDEEPLVGIPQNLPEALFEADPHSHEFKDFIEAETTEFTIVEGNRRLATAKLLLDANLREKLRIRHWPTLSAEVADDLSFLPVIVYRRRVEIVPYLGVRHIIGIQKWESYPKARYIAQMIEEGRSVDDVSELIGDKQGAVNKNYLCYRLLEQAKDEFDIDPKNVKNDFSLLLLSLGLGNIKRFLGLPRKVSDTDFDAPVPQKSLENLKKLIFWVFGDSKDGRVIQESRDITRYLAHIVVSPEAIEYLENTHDLRGAYDRTDGEEKMLLKYLAQANSRLETALGIAHRHKTFEVIAESEKCEQTVKALLKTVRAND